MFDQRKLFGQSFMLSVSFSFNLLQKASFFGNSTMKLIDWGTHICEL